jgi:hypothetical protein
VCARLYTNTYTHTRTHSAEQVFTATEHDRDALKAIGVPNTSVWRFCHNLTQTSIPDAVPGTFYCFVLMCVCVCVCLHSCVCGYGCLTIPMCVCLCWHQILRALMCMHSCVCVPGFETRSGMLFLGYGGNPTNRLALTWFFRKAWYVCTCMCVCAEQLS